MGFAEGKEAVADLAGTAEDVDTAGGHFGNNEAAVEGPEEGGGDFCEPGVGAAGTDAEGDIGPTGAEDFVELGDESGGFLQIGGDDGEAFAEAMFETGADGGEGAEVTTQDESLRVAVFPYW